MQSLYPFLDAGTIPGGLYEGIPETKTLWLGVQWVTRADQPADLVEAIARALWRGTSRELFILDNPEGRFPRLEEAARDTVVPLHPGAQAFYRSAGLM